MTFTADDLQAWHELRAPAWQHLNAAEREVPADEPWEVFDGELLDVARRPFVAPERFASWSPDELLELAVEERRRRLPMPAVADAPAGKPARMTVGRALEMLLESRGRVGVKSTAVTIGRSARGVVTWELTATADPEELEQLVVAVDAAIAQHDRLTGLYPHDEGQS